MDPGAPLLIVLAGPTAVGKSAAAVALAAMTGGEIVAADSRTVYRAMDIGTAKPSAADRARAPHHLLDVADPREVFTVARYQPLALAAIHDILARRRIPLLVGGTGLYIRAVVDGLEIPRVPPDWAFRAAAEVEERTAPGTLHARLRVLDPAAADRIDPRNLRRVIRALEIVTRSGAPLRARRREMPAPWRVVLVGLWMPFPLLDVRIARRVDDQIAAGLLTEVSGLLDAGVPPDAPAMQGLGYKEMVPVVEHRRSLEEAVALLTRNTRRYARRQMTWFRREARLHWLDVDELAPAAVAEAARAILSEAATAGP